MMTKQVEGLRITYFLMHTFEKFQDEGWRTRDAHLARALANLPNVKCVNLIDRPSFTLEVASGRRWNQAAVEQWRLSLSGSPLTSQINAVRLKSKAQIQPLIKHRGWWQGAYEKHSLSASSQRLLDHVLGQTDIVISNVPTSWPLWHNHDTKHFDTLDNWLTHPRFIKHIPNLQEDYRNAGQAATSSSAISSGTMAMLVANGFKRPEIVPNGVDQNSFRHDAKKYYKHWEHVLAEYPRPWLIYVGKMQERVDVEILSELAEQTTGTVVLAGPILNRAHIAPLMGHGRVRFLGDVVYSRVPGLMAIADVALVPHVARNDFQGDPLKTYEYAAVGVRSVSTRLDSPSAQESTHVAISSRHFVELCLELDVDPRSPDVRIDSARAIPEASWTNRARKILELALIGKIN